MSIRWRRGFKRLAIALTGLWLVPYIAMFATSKGGMISDPERFWTFLLGPILLIWVVYFLGVWLAQGFFDQGRDRQ
ncbi:hypothetical protein ACOTCG_27955 [Achromobacter xylosoxidans]